MRETPSSQWSADRIRSVEPHLLTDGGREEWTLEDHLRAALEEAESVEVRYHIRQALQYEALRRGEVDWRGTAAFGPANGGVVD